MLLTRSPLSPKSASTPWIPFDLHVLSTPPAFILSQDQTLQQKPKNKPNQKPKQKPRPKIRSKMIQARKQSSKNKHQQSKNKTFQNHQHQKNKNKKKPNPPQKNKASPVQSHTNKTKKHTIENTNNQTTNQPKLTGQDSSRAKNKRRESFSPAGICARQRIQSYRPQPPASNQIP